MMRSARTSRCGFRASWKANGCGVFDCFGDVFDYCCVYCVCCGGDDCCLKILMRILIVGGGVFDCDRCRDCVVVRRGDETAILIVIFDEVVWVIGVYVWCLCVNYC